MKKRDKIFITVIILTVIIAVLVVVLFYLNSRNKMKLWGNNENEQVNQFEEEVSMIQKQAKEKYPSFKWLSDGNLGKIQVGVEDKKVYMKVNQDGSKTYIDFDKGTPKYASSVLRGGMLEEIVVITTDGKLYIADATNYSNDGFKFKFDMCDLKEKVIDATYADEQEMYYLLESGKLVTKKLKEYIPFENKIKEIQKQAKEKYPSFKWLSDGNLGKIQVGVEDKKVYMKVNQDGSKTYIDFDKGTPKYASSVLRGGMLKEIVVITTDGYLFIADGSNYGNDNFEHNFNFEFYNLGYRVINATYANGEDMYYLLEDGRLVSKDLNEYVK